MNDRLLVATALVLARSGEAVTLLTREQDVNEANQVSVVWYGFPAAIGTKLADPERPVILMSSGDSGSRCQLSELESAVRWNIPAVLLVNNNRP